MNYEAKYELAKNFQPKKSILAPKVKQKKLGYDLKLKLITYD